MMLEELIRKTSALIVSTYPSYILLVSTLGLYDVWWYNIVDDNKLVF